MPVRMPKKEVERQLKRIKKAKEEARRKKETRGKSTKKQRSANFERLKEVAESFELGSETQEQEPDTLTADLVEGEQLIATVDRISGAGNALCEIYSGDQYHINMGRVDCTEGDEVAIEVTEVHDTHVMAQVELIWDSNENKEKSLNSSQKKVTRMSDLKPDSSGLTNRNDLLNGPQ